MIGFYVTLLRRAFAFHQGRVSSSKLQVNLLLDQSRRLGSQLTFLTLPRLEILNIVHHKPPDSKRSDRYI